jgi:hypothetical protein
VGALLELSSINFAFFKMALYRFASMNEDMGKFGYDSTQQRTKKQKIMKMASLRTFKVKFKLVKCLYFTKSCFVACEVHAYDMIQTIM